MVEKDLVNCVLDFLADQTYQGEPVLHAIIACDFASRQHMVDALARVIESKFPGLEVRERKVVYK